MADSPSSENERPQKIRRVARACLQCRARKQRCLPLPETNNLQAPCKRCRHLAIHCSFETERPSSIDATQSPSQLAQLVVELHHRINSQEKRILQLEQSQPSLQKINTDCETKETGQKQTCSPNPTQSPGSTVNGIDLGPPIATIRSLRALVKDQPTLEHTAPAETISHTAAFDAVSRGIISTSGCQRAIDLFFDHCHTSAPVLDEGIRQSWQDSRIHSHTLVLAICSIGSRFLTEANPQSTDHYKPKGLTALLDKAVAQLLLRPTSADVTLDSIRVLLLYAQWMPYNQDDERVVDVDSTTLRPPRSRYNEISAWAVLGLAMRYALLLGLDRSAIKPFQNIHYEPSKEDMSRLRVWYNLLTCNFNLMLTSGLPASVDPRLSASVAQRFGASPLARYPADLRVTALVELVSIVHEAMQSCGDVCGRQLPPTHLTKVNSEMGMWENRWLARLSTSSSQHNQMPFNSVRSYRLSLNSACCAPLLSALQQPPTQPLDTSLYEPLQISLTAACQTLLALSVFGADFVWHLDSQNQDTFPEGPFHADPDAIGRLYYTVDSTWISLTFSITFLVLCYARGIVDKNLLIYNPIQSLEPPCLSRSSSSTLARLLILALEIFDRVSSTADFHLSNDFQGVVQYAASLVLEPEDEQQANQEMNDSAIQSLLGLMNESGMEWAGNMFGEGGLADWDFNQFAGA